MPQPALAQSLHTTPDFGPGAPELTESATGLWIVQLADAPLATYGGDLAGLPATSPAITGADRLDVEAPASVRYLDYLADQQAEAVAGFSRALGRDVAPQFEYLNVLNAVALRISAAEAAQLASLPGVTNVFPDEIRELETDVSHELMGSASFWDGVTGPDLATSGEGVVIGMLDTGVNAFHPSFAEVDGDGYVHDNPLGSGEFVGACAPDHADHQDVCNDKLIGAWNFNTTGPSYPDVLDRNSHGSHVGGTIAGNRHEATFSVGGDEYTRTIQGVAPRANVISYLVCDPGCPQTASVAAVNQAIADPTNVLNYSISGTDNPWVDAVDLAFLDAFEAGIFVAASAGNTGPAATVAKTGPWNATVAASTLDRIIHHDLDVTGPGPVPAELVGLAAAPANPLRGPIVEDDITAEIRHVVGNAFGCQSFAAGAFEGALALIQRGGGCNFAVKVNNAAAAGAVGVVLFSDMAGPPVFLSGLETTSIPAVNLSLPQGSELRDFIVDSSPEPTEVHLHGDTALLRDDAYQDIVATFSARGPSQFNVLAPTFAAPGVNVLAAGVEIGGDPLQYMFNQGTSMSSPHGAGSAALLMALHPEWSPAEVRSALAGTADPDVLAVDDEGTPATAFDHGSGRVDLEAAARTGLVMDESHANFVAANPAAGGDPRTLNVPHLVDRTCGDECSFTRTVTSVADAPVTYQAEVDAPAGTTVSVSPAEFSIDAGASQEIVVTVTGQESATGDWAFGDLRLTTTDSHSGGAAVAGVHYPIVVIAQAPVDEAPAIEVSPAELSVEVQTDQAAEEELTIANTGTGELTWSITEAEQAGATEEGSALRAVPDTVPPASTLERDYQNVPASDVILDGGFEAGSPNPFWDEGSTTFGTPLCTIDVCGFGNGTGPRNGEWWTWFGGIAAPETGFVRQDVTLQPGVAELRFWLEIPAAGGSGDDFLRVSLDDTEVFSVTDADAADYATYAEVVVDVSDFADGGTYTLSFDSTVSGVGTTNFFIDDVSLDNQGAPGACAAPGDVPWLSVSPASGSTEPGGSSSVAVSFDAAGVEPGDYEALLCVASNDPVSPVVEVPVSMSVVEDDDPPGGPVVCDETITGVHAGALTVTEGVTCLAAGAQVLGEVNVSAGAGLVATAAVVQGPVSAVGAAVVDLSFTQVTGPVVVSGATGSVSLFASQVTGSVSVVNGATASAAVVAGNTIIGSLSCLGNDPAPTDLGLANTATGGKLGQCAEL
ncbi:S8 family serine peptidase [Natronosporangium hydrolyticum]|uniref:S8 family serine peptidase n=1 Tax=Natronosporangium hydrolyticum TaxID=2811111 RepID=A0A895Y7D3_9ACTN|nr:S8 family serine peptidase [Natronosporangium hydrolyticum]QSB13644.1 S8 family serine peptidase [Natronosporangium hydrolyticum]